MVAAVASLRLPSATASKLTTLTFCAAVFGFTLGWSHSVDFALRNLIKFPLLLIVVCAICTPFYYVISRFFGVPLRLGAVWQAALQIFRDLAVLLSTLAPLSFFFASTFDQPTKESLNGYPGFLAMAVLLIACAGVIAVVHNTRRLAREMPTHRRGLRNMIFAWLLCSLLVGGQWAWYLRPFLGVAREPTPFCLGNKADYRGATNFFEAIYHLVNAPELPRDFLRRGWSR